MWIDSWRLWTRILSIQSASLAKMLYLREVNKTLSYLRQCLGKDFGLLMGMAYHKLLHCDSSIEPNVLNRTDMSTLFVLIQDQSVEKVSYWIKIKIKNIKFPTIIGRPFSQQVVAELLAPPFAPTPLLSEATVPAFCDVCDRAPGESAGWVPPLGLNEGGLVSDKGDWALVVVVGAAVAVCPRSCNRKEKMTIKFCLLEYWNCLWCHKHKSLDVSIYDQL